ncbi:MAG: hypothetical protein MUC88_25450, partial [Planctomycetes bacterium]|nr:hypothetical protein [Planctomycetota bacterium]
MDLRQRGAVHQVGGGGTQTIHYGDGTTLTGTEITNFGQWEGGVLACNDGATVRILGSGEYYFSTDSKLTSHPAVWSFGSVTDGMVIDQRSYYVVKSDRSSWLQESNQLLLFDIQEVKVLEGTYSQAVIIWYLDAQYAFAPLDLAMLKPGLKILPPRSSDTRGYAVTGFDVFGLHTGLIASGDVDAQSGGLRESAELRAVVQPSASGFGDLAGVWQLHGLSAPGGEWTNWVRGTWTVNTDGSSDGLLHRSNGTTSPLRGTVTMASYGVFRVDPFQYTHGVIGSDRNLMVLVTTDSRGEHQMLLGIRSGTAAVGATPCPCPDDDPADGIYRICNYWPLHPGNQWIYTTGDY